MGGYYGMAVLVGVACLVMTSEGGATCSGVEGRAGVDGAPGRDGWPGVKGEKGEPAAMAEGPVDAHVLQRLKGEMGMRGSQGTMGPKGYAGDLGPAGLAGLPGAPGPEGKRIISGKSSPHQARSAFSAMRTLSAYPPFERAVTFQTVVVNQDNDFNKNTGYFTCRVPGFYYFSFHSVAKVGMCLRISSEAVNNLGFCDYNTRNSDQVMSGGVVLQLTAGERVWLTSFKDAQPDSVTKDVRDKFIIFNGFLLFSSPV
ncbi:complement C1q subcomponent subunit A [Echeneis naucrates]|nr:complement C1q subcomponent subunit A-like [Echeneis naucrates]